MRKPHSILTWTISLLATLCHFKMSIPAQEPPTNPLTSNYMPRVETQALEFLRKYPEFDGRKTLVAVLDTGVDPTAAGLKTTSDGRPKIIDLIDATGSGDVDMSTVVTAVDQGTIQSVHGRPLKLNPSWVVPTGEFRVGLKNGFELFPGPAVDRYKEIVKKERSLATLSRIRDLQSQLLSKSLSQSQRDEINERIIQLDKLNADWDPIGPLYDCVVFHDGVNWQACIDTDQDGSFANESLLMDFNKQYQLSSFDPRLGVYYGIHIYDQGNTLSIVTDSGAHGTHVAGIIAAHFPDKPEFNGVAPGAQILSIKIGDHRLDGMETTTAIERALTAISHYQCDLINMSYGEPTTRPNQGRLDDLIQNTILEKNVIFVSSAGNAGPALYSVGSPGGTTSSIFAIGAYISPGMAAEQYGMADSLNEGFYTWSSRGPTFDGDLGVDFAAPGGAIAPVPQWSGTSKLQMNGTSMASPNACGNIALILSGLKNRGISHTPIRVYRALANTARKLNESTRFAQGHGLIQTLNAFEKLLEYADATPLNTPVRITTNIPASQRGIQIVLDPTAPGESPETFSYSIRLSPWFSENAGVERRVAYERTLHFKAEHPWIHIPEKAFLQSDGTRIQVRLTPDPAQIPFPFHTEINVYDSEFEEFGPIARIPITLLGLQSPGEKDSGIWHGGGPFHPGDISRTWIRPPQWAQWAEIRIQREGGTDEKARFIFHSVQKIPGSHYQHHESKRTLYLSADMTVENRFPVVGAIPLELVLAPYWSSSESTHLNWELKFFGNHISPDPVHIEGSQGITQVTAFPSPDGRLQTRIKPEGQLNVLWRPIKPAESTLRPLLDPRDQLVDGTYAQEIILRYPFSLSQESSVIPRFSALQEQLYELEFSSQLWEIRNHQNFRFTSDDTFPDPVSLPAGEYHLLYHFRHPKPEILEKLKNIPIALEIPINSIPLKFFAKAEDYILEGSSVNLTISENGEPVQFYAGIPFNSSMPSAAKAGDTLHGHINWIVDEPTTHWNEAAPVKIPVTYSLPIEAASSQQTHSGPTPPLVNKSIEQTIRDTRLQFLRAIPGDNMDDFNQLASQLLEMDPAWMDVLVEKLHRLDSDTLRPDHLIEILNIAASILNLIDQEQLARIVHIPEKYLSDPDKKNKEAMARLKPILIDTLFRQCRTIAYIEDPSLNLKNSALPDSSPSFDGAFQALGNWVNTTEKEFLLVHIRNSRRHKEFAQGLKLLQPHVQKFNPDNLPFHKKRLKLLQELDWTDWANIAENEIHYHYPKIQTQRF